MNRRRIQHSIDGLLALLLFAVFAVCILAVLLTGAKAYRRLTERDQAAYDSRTCVQYIAARVRQSDSEGRISVAPFAETNALTMQESGGFVTRVYWYDGYLMELYAAEDSDLVLSDGTKILQAEKVDFALENGLLTVEIKSGGKQDILRLSLRSGEEAGT